MLKKYKRGILITWLMLILLSGIVVSNIVFASASDYSLSNKEVALNGRDDGEVEITFNTAKSGSFYAIEAIWNTKEEGTSYFELTDLVANSGANPSYIFNNNVSDGRILYDDPDVAAGFSVSANGNLWTAKYKIDKDTPAGNYQIKLHVNAIIGNSDETEEFDLSSTVTITRDGKISIVPVVNGYQSTYEYNGNKIEPEITVSDYITSAVLEKNIDYTVTYGGNTDAGTGTITVHPVSSSVYSFTETTVNFTINKFVLTESNVICPESIMYTGIGKQSYRNRHICIQWMCQLNINIAPTRAENHIKICFCWL